MMFDKDLFYSLCEKYDVELSDRVDQPMLRDGDGMHPVTGEDIKRILGSYQFCFDHSDNRTKINTVSVTYYIQEDFAVAC